LLCNRTRESVVVLPWFDVLAMASATKAGGNSRPPRRRGKKEASLVDASRSSATIISSNSDTNKNGDKVLLSLEDQLDRAQEAVRQNKISTQVLHGQWRTSLLRLSYLLVILSFHQTMSPTTSCLRDIKAFNDHHHSAAMSVAVAATLSSEAAPSGDVVVTAAIRNNTDHHNNSIITAYKATLVVLTDSMENVLGIVMAAALAFFLSLENPHGDFSNPRYVLATGCIPPMLGLHFHHERNTSNKGCIDDLLAQVPTLEPKDRTRGDIPVVLIFYVIVTLCYYFMDFQMNVHDSNRRKILQLRQDLMEVHTSETRAEKAK
jgi:hypothetical protein